MTLHVSKDLDLPDSSVTQTFAILAKRGAGKSNAAVVMAEAMFDAGLPWVAVDPKGDWWGVRSSKTGKSAGLAVLVLGGEHGDVPLEATSGAVVADMLVEQRVSAVVDVSLFSKADMRRFLTDFAERLYRQNRQPLHVFAEEAHEYIPQRFQGDSARMVGAWEKLVKWGRTHGLGVTLITQRSASLNNDVLTQVDTLIALRTTGPSDQKAVRAWVDEHDSGVEVMAKLRGLDNGQAFVISPSFLRMEAPRLIRFAQRRTFDSGATPEAGAEPLVARTRADVDLAALKEAMGEAIERAEADDPAKLHARIKELQYLVGEAQEQRDAARVQLDEALAKPRQIIPELLLDWLRTSAQQTVDAVADLEAGIITRSDLERGITVQTPPVAATPLPPRERPTPPPVRAARARPVPAAGSGEKLPGVQREILTVLAQQGGRSAQQVAILTGRSAKGGGFRNAVGALRSAGYVTGGNALLSITEEGSTALGDWDPLPTGAALLEFWCNESSITGAGPKVLRELVAAYPATRSAWQLADALGYEATGGGFRNALGRLRSLDLIAGGNAGMQASAELVGP